MEETREGLRDHVVALLSASRELSPADDEALADTFVSRIGHLPHQRSRLTPLTCTSVSALAILLAIPVVMVGQTYSNLDGYLPPLDAGALPLVYWIALVLAVVLTTVALVGQRVDWRARGIPSTIRPR
jgi:hypothetical protein